MTGEPVRTSCYTMTPRLQPCNGVFDATTDPERIVTWWTRMLAVNIDGQVPSGVVVIDVDPRHGRDET